MMNMNENIIKGKWLEMKGEIQKAWGRLTDDELDKTKGDMKAVAGLIQQRYGESQDDWSKKLSSIYAQFMDKKDSSVDKLKEELKEH